MKEKNLPRKEFQKTCIKIDSILSGNILIWMRAYFFSILIEAFYNPGKFLQPFGSPKFSRRNVITQIMERPAHPAYLICIFTRSTIA